MKLSEKAKIILKELKKLDGKREVTAKDLTTLCKLGNDKVTNGVITMSLQRNGLTIRVPAVLEMPDGISKPVKFIRLTDEGREIIIEEDA